MQGELWRRSRVLVGHLVGVVLEADPEPVPLVELRAGACDLLDSRGKAWSAKTVANTVADLEAFGVVRVTARGGRASDRVVTMTVLGLAWYAGRLLPGPGALGALEAEYEALVAWFDPDEVDEPEDWSPEIPGAVALAEAVEVDVEHAGLEATVGAEGMAKLRALAEDLAEAYGADLAEVLEDLSAGRSTIRGCGGSAG